MLKLVPIFAVLFLNPTLAADQDNRIGRLRDVNTVYVAELGQTVRAKNLRQEIMKRLVESKRIRLADAPDKADAVLSVSVAHRTRNVDSPYETFGDGMQIGSKVVNTAEIVLRLDAHQDRTLWSDRFDTGNSAAKNERQATQALANRVSLKFLKAVEKDRKRRR